MFRLNRLSALKVVMVFIFFSAFRPDADACTTIVIKAKDGTVVRGRSMEFARPLGSQVIVVPRGTSYAGTLPDGGQGLKWTVRHGFAGVNAEGLPLAIDGVNEKGLAGGQHYFSGFAQYGELSAAERGKGLAPWEFVSWILSSFETVDDIVRHLDEVRIAPSVEKASGVVLPLHYSFTDASGHMIVIEPTDGRLKVFENPYGVFTNNPTFDWHVTNLRNYVSLRAEDVQSADICGVKVHEISGGSGMHDIPGDFTSPSRFVRAACLKSWASQPGTGQEALVQVMHLLESFFRLDGYGYEMVNDARASMITEWETFIDLSHRKLYFRTYGNPDIRLVDFSKCSLSKGPVLRYQMEEAPKFRDVTDRLK